MDKSEICSALLRAFSKDFEKEEMPIAMGKKEETGIPTDILRVGLTDYGLMPGVLAEFFFLDLPNGAEDILYFYIVINVAEEVDETRAGQVCEAIAKLNHYIPGGAFTIDAAGKILVYKETVYLPANKPEEELLYMMNIYTGHSLSMAEPYISLLHGLATGENELEEILELLPK